MFVTQSLARYMKRQVGSKSFSIENLNLLFQTPWVARTVMVKENNVEEAMKVLNGIMSREGMLKRWECF